MKSGKTTAACQFPNHLLLAFEKGYNALGNVMAADMVTWSDFKSVLKQLEKQEAKDTYKTIVIDTVSIAWELCEKYICAQNGVTSIADIPWGQGYSASKQEFENALRKITQLGYGLVLICHDTSHIEKLADGNEIEVIAPELPKRARDICNSLVDIIGFINVENTPDGTERWLYTRETSTVFAGSRFKYLPEKIKFDYNELVNAINEAIDKSEKLDGATVVDKAVVKEKEKLDYDKIKNEAADIWGKMTDEQKRQTLDYAQTVFGKPVRLSEISKSQVELYKLVLDEMQEIVSNN